MLVGMASQYRYCEIVDANDPKWLAELKGCIDKGKQVAVVHITPSQIRDCYAYAQEHDFTSVVEDKGDYRELVIQDYPEILPSILGFVHRDPSKRIRY
jgi:hypothetical protein